MESTEQLNNKYQPTQDWKDNDWELFESWLRGVLHSNIVDITFIKKDGTERIMKCTLDPSLLPEITKLTETKTKKQSTTSIPVYDLEASGWRSFVTKSVKRVQFTLSQEKQNVL